MDHGRNTLYSSNPISKVPSWWEIMSLPGNFNAFKNKNGESEGKKKDTEGQGWSQVLSGIGGHRY